MASKTFLFDLDGTLWNSAPWYAEVISRQAQVAKSEVYASLTKGENVIRLCQRLGIRDTCLARACEKQDVGEILYPGVLETVERLVHQEAKLGVVTNLPKRIAGPLLRKSGLEQFMSTAIYAAGKPLPGGILRAVREIGAIPNTHVCYVGDTVSDAMAARRAGISFLWASYSTKAEVPTGVWEILADFTDLLRL